MLNGNELERVALLRFKQSASFENALDEALKLEKDNKEIYNSLLDEAFYIDKDFLGDVEFFSAIKHAAKEYMDSTKDKPKTIYQIVSSVIEMQRLHKIEEVIAATLIVKDWLISNYKLTPRHDLTSQNPRLAAMLKKLDKLLNED